MAIFWYWMLFLGNLTGTFLLRAGIVCHLQSLLIFLIQRTGFLDAGLWKTHIIFIPSPLLLSQAAFFFFFFLKTINCLDIMTFQVFHQFLRVSLFFCTSILMRCTECCLSFSAWHCWVWVKDLLESVVYCLAGFRIMFNLLLETLPGMHSVFLGCQGWWGYPWSSHSISP